MSCKICQKKITSEFQKCNNIGMGSYSTIFLVCNENKPKYIIKSLFEKNDNEINTCQVINSLQNINKADFVTIINNSIIYKYIEGDSLNNYLYQSDIYQFTLIIKKVIDQLYFLEKQGFYHLDINFNNIIIQNNEPFLIDYGNLTKKNSKLKREYYGSYGFVPPEYFNDKILIIDKFDVFSIGIMLFNKLAGFNPLNMSKYYKMKCWFWCKDDSCKDRSKCMLNYLNKNLKKTKLNEIIVQCIDFDEKNRINIENLYYLLNKLVL